ncbi:hypothetical protein C8R45DRAFT_882453 [Mycena sanguinolenta]|nr:hypothetical protein C8R45DRAFT_882453 [Mycena sanguinolenta]
MLSIEDLLNDHTVTVFSARRKRQKFSQDIDLALKDVDAAYASIKAASRSPVKQALKLLRRRSKLNLHLSESRVLADENAMVLSLAKDLSSGRNNLLSLPLSDISLLLRALQTRRNSLASISCLPTEVLTPILEYCPTIHDDKPEFRTAKFIRGSLSVPHVCRRWREIALKSSQFWTNIVLSRPRWALEMLHRSRGAPLVVGADFGASFSKNIAARDLVLAQLFRVRELHLHMPGDSSLPASLLVSAPLLDTFHLHYARPTEVVIPAKLFQGEAPQLQHLSLQYCLLEWDSPLWKNLVSLELINSPISIHLLGTMSRLRALTLTASYVDMSNVEPIALDLEMLNLTGSILNCCRFLEAVFIPKSRIMLHVLYTSGDLRWMWDAIEKHRTEAADPVIYGLKFADVLRGPSSAGASVFELEFFNQASRSLPRFSVRLSTGSPSPRWRDDAMTTLLAIVSLDQVVTLTMKCEALKISASFLHLKHFRSAAFHRDIAAFTDQLESDPLMTAGDRFDAANVAVHYPRLRKIAFHEIAFSERHTEIILDWLAQRKRLNLAIEEMQLIGCTFTAADRGSLQELVGHVYVEDG